MRRIATRTLSGLAALVMVCSLGGAATLFWLVRHDHWTVQTVATGSMAPTVPTGSLLLSRPVDAGAVRPGDVIVFTSPVGHTAGAGADGAFSTTTAMLITHRVIAITTTPGGQLGFRTKGDANADEDPWVLPAAAVHARTVTHLAHVGGWLARPDARRWLYLTVAAAGLLVIAVESRRVVRELRRTRASAPAHGPASTPM